MSHLQSQAAYWKHPIEMDAEELRELVGAMGWMALDLAQHLAFCEGMKPEFKEEAWKKATAMAYELASFPYDGPTLDRSQPPGVTVFGADGIVL